MATRAVDHYGGRAELFSSGSFSYSGSSPRESAWPAVSRPRRRALLLVSVGVGARRGAARWSAGRLVQRRLVTLGVALVVLVVVFVASDAWLARGVGWSARFARFQLGAEVLAYVQGLGAIGLAVAASGVAARMTASLLAKSDPGVPAAAAAAKVVRSLRADIATFTGRDEQIQGITQAISTNQAAGGVVAIHAINGMPGVGKTALAVHIGHLVADRFPAGNFSSTYAPTASIKHLPNRLRSLPRCCLPPVWLPSTSPTGKRNAPRGGATRWPASGCCWCWTTRPATSRSNPCCPIPRAAWSWSPAAADWPDYAATTGPPSCRWGPARSRRGRLVHPHLPQCDDRSRPASRGGTGEYVWPPAAGHHHRRRRGRPRRAHQRR